MTPSRLQLVLPSVFDRLEEVVDATQALMDAHGVDDDLAYRVVLLATEAVTNAMEHGNELDADKSVRLDVEVEPAAITIVVEDEGPGFDRSAVENPVAPDNLLAEGGRGIFLIEHMADEVRYEDHGRRVHIRFSRP